MPDRDALSILVPDAVLPAEGTPPARVRPHANARPNQPAALLEALTFALFARQSALNLPEPAQAWCHAYLRPDPAGPGGVWLDLTPGRFELDIDAAGFETVAEASPRHRQIAAIRLATRPFAGRPVPLFAPGSDGAAPSAPLVIWLATPEQLLEFTSDGVGDAFEFWLEEAEVSGRGVREVALAAAIFVLGFQVALPIARADTAAVAVASAGEPGAAAADLQVLPVTSQNLHQPPPRVDPALLADHAATSDPARTRIVVDIAAQRAYLIVDDRIAVDTPVSTGRAGHDTPRGTFTITEKVRDGKFSSIYGSALPFWMRLGDTAVGMHVERLPGQAASHGCVRLPRESAKVLFEHTPSGATVQIVDSWTQNEVALR